MMRGNRDMRRMLDKMGLNMQEMTNIEEVVIRTDSKEIFLIKPQVIEMKGKESTIFQIVAGDIEETVGLLQVGGQRCARQVERIDRTLRPGESQALRNAALFVVLEEVAVTGSHHQL